MAEPSSPTGLNPTSASLLGLLAIDAWHRPWTSYELAKQAGRSLYWFWPRAKRQLLSVPKTLVALGYAEAHDHPIGRRAGTSYTITPAGRAALRAWLDEPGQGVQLEAEQLIRVFFADQGDITQLHETLRRIAEHAIQDRQRLAAITSGSDAAAIPGRQAVNALSIRLVADVQATIERWAAWALDQTSQWDNPRAPWPEAAQIFADVTAAGSRAPTR